VAETISIAASVRIQAPVDMVRAQYRDIDHHIRANVHPDVTYSWEPAGPGERKVRSTFKVLGVRQFDVALLEDRRDGTFLIRYVQGTKVGMVMRHEFIAAGDGTEVRITVEAPGTVGRKLMGPLFKLATLQAIKKAMAEDRADLEAGRYRVQPPRPFEQALAELDAVAKRGDAQASNAILRAGCILSAADASLQETERDALGSIAKKLGIDDAAVEASVHDLVDSPDFGAEARQHGEKLAKLGVAREGLLAATVVALVSEGMSMGELAALRALAEGAGVPDEELQPLVDRVDAAMSA
jgi:hypothetical protein